MRAVRFELAFVAVIVTATLAFWSLYATPFWQLIVTTSDAFPLLLIGGAFVVAVVPLVIRLRRRWSWRFRPRARTVRAAAVATGLAFIVAVAIVTVASIEPVPGTSIRVRLADMVPFLPMFAFLAVAAGGRKVLDFSPEGIALTASFVAIVGSIVLGAYAASDTLIPYRHLEYATVPLAVMVGAGFRWMGAGWLEGRRSIAVGLVGVILVASTAASAYPPPAALAGIEEGIAAKTVEATLWVRANVPGDLVAGDHREWTASCASGARRTCPRRSRQCVRSDSTPASSTCGG
ncbi:MAG: hypothetical protein E6K18_06025 [Methanobacteriota archaeon]|nr:MAG: hypothetical protein E6K18_06025 [Euryarchaeota archaeon]